jgi:hypothetical protein
VLTAEAVAWSIEVFGQVGPYVRQRAPQVLLGAHSRYVANQVALDLDSNDPYGLMWLGLPKALVDDFEGLPGVQMHRARGGRYRLPVVHGVPVVPWRYAKDSGTDVEHVPFGQPVSRPRRALFDELTMQLELPLGGPSLGEEVMAALPPRVRREAEGFAAGIRTLMAHEKVGAVLAYASTPDGVHRCYFGYATLRDNDLLSWKFREEIEIATVVRSNLRLVQERLRRPAFDDGEPAAPMLRKRSPLEGLPTGVGEQPTSPDEADADD